MGLEYREHYLNTEKNYNNLQWVQFRVQRPISKHREELEQSTMGLEYREHYLNTEKNQNNLQWIKFRVQRTLSEHREELE